MRPRPRTQSTIPGWALVLVAAATAIGLLKSLLRRRQPFGPAPMTPEEAAPGGSHAGALSFFADGGRDALEAGTRPSGEKPPTPGDTTHNASKDKTQSSAPASSVLSGSRIHDESCQHLQQGSLAPILQATLSEPPRGRDDGSESKHPELPPLHAEPHGGPATAEFAQNLLAAHEPAEAETRAPAGVFLVPASEGASLPAWRPAAPAVGPSASDGLSPHDAAAPASDAAPEPSRSGPAHGAAAEAEAECWTADVPSPAGVQGGAPAGEGAVMQFRAEAAGSAPPPRAEERAARPETSASAGTLFSERAPSAFAPVGSARPAKRPVLCPRETVRSAGPNADNNSPRRPKRPASMIDASEYTGPGVPPPADYIECNRLLSVHLFDGAPAGRLHLPVSPRLLATALSESPSSRLSPPAAEERFVGAVRLAYRECVLGGPWRLNSLRRPDPEVGVPLCVGVLALSVLAAHKMHTGETFSSSAYYARLAGLLDVPLNGSGLPEGFVGTEFEALWRFLARWASESADLTLALPEADAHRRYVAYPLEHVPLRQLDLEKLPAFFEWAGYRAGESVAVAALGHDLDQWSRSRAALSEAGREALRDGRRPAVLAQAAAEIRAWDGTVAESAGVRQPQVEIVLSMAMRRPQLHLLAPCREGYPPVFRAGEIEISGGPGWYDPLELGPGDGHLLLDGFEWAAEGAPGCLLRRPRALAVVLAPSEEHSGFVSRRHLPKEMLCAVLCHEPTAGRVAPYLAEVCGAAPKIMRGGSLPDGWLVFAGVRARRAAAGGAPEGLPSLELASQVTVSPQGGLRLGSGWTWMEGHPPRLLVAGHDGAAVLLNGVPVCIDGDGWLQDGGELARAGTWTLKVGAMERRLEIARPVMRPSPPPAASATRTVALGQGAWHLLGAAPFQVAQADVAGRGGSLARCDFEPVWAVAASARRGPKVMQLSALPPKDIPGRLRQSPAAQRWVAALYEASVRRPNLQPALGVDLAAAEAVWGRYVEAAKRIKRQWRARR